MTTRTCIGKRGMTLVEVLAVVVLLGLVAATLMVGFAGTFSEAKRQLAKTGVSVIAAKLELYRMINDCWPNVQQGLGVLSDAAPTACYHVPPSKLIDPWGHPYGYRRPGPAGHPFEIVSLGADGEDGGVGEDADISSAALRGGR